MQADTSKGIKVVAEAYAEEAKQIGLTSQQLEKLITLTRQNELNHQKEAEDLAKVETYQNAIRIAQEKQIPIEEALAQVIDDRIKLMDAEKVEAEGAIKIYEEEGASTEELKQKIKNLQNIYQNK